MDLSAITAPVIRHRASISAGTRRIKEPYKRWNIKYTAITAQENKISDSYILANGGLPATYQRSMIAIE